MSNEISNVKLEDFVSEVLTQIISGITTAQEHAKEKGAFINSRRFFRNGDKIFLDKANHESLVEEIDFDVAITVSSQGNLKGGIGIFVPAGGLGYQAQKDTGNSTISRIRFKIPISFPWQQE